MLSLPSPNGMADSDNFHPIFEYSKAPDLDLIQEKAMDEKFGWPRAMLAMTGLLFADEKSRFWRVAKILRATIFALFALYQTLFFLQLLLSRGKFDLESSRLLIGFSWLLQASLTIAFLFYYQFTDRFDRIRRSVHIADGCPCTVWVIKRTIILYCALLLGATVICVAIIVVVSEGFTRKTASISEQLYEGYGSRALFPLAILVYTWSMFVWMSGLAFFVSVVTALHHELCAFNDYHLKKIGLAVEGQMEKVAEQLQDCYVRHVELANRVRAIDSAFEVYTFTMLAVNVPTAIFSILGFLLSIQGQSWHSVFLTIPDLMFCTVELVGLTSAPAKIHATIRDVESIIYGNMRIWKPYNEKVYRLASIFISHANQSNLGISLWGFVVVTKPLILTVISLTVSYLTFVLQVRPQKAGFGANETLQFTFSL